MAVIGDIRLPDIVAAFVEAEGLRFLALPVQQQMPVLAAPGQPGGAFAEDFDHPLVAVNAGAEAAHGVVFPVEPFGARPHAVPRRVGEAEDDDGDIDRRRRIGVVGGAGAPGRAWVGAHQGVNLGDGVVEREILGGGEKMNRMVEEPWPGAASRPPRVEPPAALLGAGVDRRARAPQPGAVAVADLQRPADGARLDQFPRLDVRRMEDVGLVDREREATLARPRRAARPRERRRRKASRRARACRPPALRGTSARAGRWGWRCRRGRRPRAPAVLRSRCERRRRRGRGRAADSGRRRYRRERRRAPAGCAA